jgi:hypothetical protein
MVRFGVAALVGVLARFPALRAGTEDVMAATGLSGWTVTRAMREALLLGEVEWYEDYGVGGHEARRLVLTPLGAYRAGVKLTDDSEFWIPIDEDEATYGSGTATGTTTPGGSRDLDDPDYLWETQGIFWNCPDHRYGSPIARVIAFEEMDRGESPSHPDFHPIFNAVHPYRRFLGDSSIWPVVPNVASAAAWDGVAEVPPNLCPLHPPERLGAHEYCLVCDARKDDPARPAKLSRRERMIAYARLPK